MLGLLALGFTACDDSSTLGVEQHNPQEAIMSANGITVEWGQAISGNSVDLNNYVDREIPVINLVSAENLPAGATVEYEMQVADNADFNNAETLNVTGGSVSGNNWEDTYLKMIGKSPLAKQNWVRFAVYVKQGSQISRVGGNDTWFAAKELTVTPVDLKLPVEGAYHFSENGVWTPMTHSSAHQYDDPNFSLIFEVSATQAAAGYKWLICTESYLQNGGVAGTVYGVSDTGDPAALSGNLLPNTEGGVEGVINAAGTYKIEVNMLDLTYKIGTAYDVLYTPGPANGWGFTDNMLLSTNDYINYSGYVYVDSEFKFAANASWDINWGEGASAGTLAPGGSNIKVSENGLYYVTVNLNELTYTMTKINTIGIIGSLNGWGLQINLTPSADYKTWTGEATFTDGLDWKFRMNDNWDYNLGGTFDNLVGNGDNLFAPSTGTFTVTLDLGKLPYSCTMVKK